MFEERAISHKRYAILFETILLSIIIQLQVHRAHITHTHTHSHSIQFSYIILLFDARDYSQPLEQGFSQKVFGSLNVIAS